MITIVMTTYQPEGSQRAHYMEATVESLVKHIVVDGKIRLLIADDGSPNQDMNNKMLDYVEQYHNWVGESSYVKREGIGGSLNKAMTFVVNGPWIYTTDDWMLTADLDLTLPMYLLERYDYVRIGAIHPNIVCYPRFEQGHGWWLELDASKGGYAFATRPFLATRNFYSIIGPFKDHCTSYDMETDYALRVAASNITIDPIRLAHVGPLEGLFTHIGEEVNPIGATFP